LEDKISVGQVFSEGFSFPCQFSSHQLPHISDHPIIKRYTYSLKTNSVIKQLKEIRVVMGRFLTSPEITIQDYCGNRNLKIFLWANTKRLC
jgi:hypothetical protein